MQSLHSEAKIEAYLESVRERLGVLPEEERAAELVEIRNHLLDLTRAHVGLGLSEGEAMQAAFRQFGNPKAVGADLRRVWKRGRQSNLPGTVLSAATWAVAATLPMDCFNSLVRTVLVNVTHQYHTLWNWLPCGLYGFFYLGCLQAVFTGYVTGRKAPRRAVAGVLLTQAVFTAYSICTFYWFVLPKYPAAALPTYLTSSAISIAIGLAAHLLGVAIGRKRFLVCQRRKQAMA